MQEKERIRLEYKMYIKNEMSSNKCGVPLCTKKSMVECNQFIPNLCHINLCYDHHVATKSGNHYCLNCSNAYE